MEFSKFVDRALWTLMVGTAAYMASKVDTATVSVNGLNEKMAVVISKMGIQDSAIQDHESRLRALEQRRHVGH